MAYDRPPLAQRSVVWIDTETTGLDPFDNDIIEFAAIRVFPNGEEAVHHFKVKMERPENAHPKALEVNGYTEESWSDAKEPAEAWQELASSRVLSNCIIAGQNVRFDVGFLQATFKRHGIDIRMGYHLYDTCSLSIEHLGEFVNSISLSPICVALGIPLVRGKHTALADARLAMAVGKKLTKATAEDRAEWGRVIPTRLAAWEEAGKPATWPVT